MGIEVSQFPTFIYTFIKKIAPQKNASEIWQTRIQDAILSSTLDPME
jgi:hypothetical protein